MVRGELRAPDHCAHPRQQLLDAKGFGEVVVGAQIETMDLVRILSTRRQEMMGTEENSRTRCVTVKPSMRGIMMSSSARSGACASICSSAACPSLTAMTS